MCDIPQAFLAAHKKKGKNKLLTDGVTDRQCMSLHPNDLPKGKKKKQSPETQFLIS